MAAHSTLLDLSWPIRPGMPMFPGDPPVEFASMGTIATHGYRSQRITLPAHNGTHMDAPAHVLEQGASLCDLPVWRFVGPGLRLDLRLELLGRPAPAVTEADLAPHLPRLRALAPAFVLLLTGDAARFADPAYYTAGAHLTPGAAQLLAGLPGLSGIGLDAASADPLEARGLPAHRALLGAGLVIIENLRGLEELPDQGFRFFCAPVLGGDGSPVRALAEILPGGAA